MTYLKSTWIGTTAVSAICLTACISAAYADMTVTSHMSMDSPMMRKSAASMPQISAMMDKMSNTTTYISGHKVRVDTAFMSMIMDPAAHKMWMLNPNTHTFTVMPLNPDQMKRMIPGGSRMPSIGSSSTMQYKVTDTGQTTKILGHVARHYKTKMTINAAGKPTTMTQDIMAAQDLPGADFGAYSRMLGNSTQVHGLPLMTTTHYNGGFGGGMTIVQKVTGISTKPISPTLFRVPAGYKQSTAEGMFSPGMFGGMGHR